MGFAQRWNRVLGLICAGDLWWWLSYGDGKEL